MMMTLLQVKCVVLVGADQMLCWNLITIVWNKTEMQKIGAAMIVHFMTEIKTISNVEPMMMLTLMQNQCAALVVVVMMNST